MFNFRIEQLTSDIASLKKKSNYCLGSLSVILTGKQLNLLIKQIIATLKKTHKKNKVYAYIQAIGAIASTVGNKKSQIPISLLS